MSLERCPWSIAGPVLGPLIVALRALVNKPLGAPGGYINLVELRARPLGFSGSGVSLGAPASIADSMTFFATAVALAHALSWIPGGAW